MRGPAPEGEGVLGPAAGRAPGPPRAPSARGLPLRRCRDCGQHVLYAPALCPFCLSEHLEPPAARPRTRVDTPPAATYDGIAPDLALLALEPLLGPDTN